MANQLKMADIQAILALHGHGWSGRRIARELGIHRGTVSGYVRQADSKPASTPGGGGGKKGAPAFPQAIPQITADELQAQAGAAKSPAPSSAAWPWREVIAQKVDEGLSAQRIFQDLSTPEQGYHGSYYSVRRLVKKLAAALPLPMRRMEVEAGQEAQVDFGRGAPVVGVDGKRRSTWVFRIVLSHSRKAYAEAVFRQSTDDFLRCLENAFAHFGGVPKTLVIDNLRAAVKQGGLVRSGAVSEDAVFRRALRHGGPAHAPVHAPAQGEDRKRREVCEGQFAQGPRVYLADRRESASAGVGSESRRPADSRHHATAGDQGLHRD